MIFTLRILLVTMLVAWQIVPAAARADLVWAPRVCDLLDFGTSNDDKNSLLLDDRSAEPVELTQESSFPLTHLIVPEIGLGMEIPLQTGAKLCPRQDKVISGFATFLYKDRGPPLRR